MRWSFHGGVLIVAVLLIAGCSQVEGGNAAPQYTLLDDAGSQLRADFNRAKGSVRLLFVVDPICPGCLRGLDDVNRDLLSKTDNARLQTFVVHVPVLGAEAKDIARATKLLEISHVRHYWNPTGTFGRQLSQAVGLKQGDKPVYAWDVWLIYGPETTWDGVNPPRPRLLMHQLRALQDSAQFPPLDSKVFAQQVQLLLSQASPAPVTTK